MSENETKPFYKSFWGFFASVAAALGLVVGFVANIDTIRHWIGGKAADISISQSPRSEALLNPPTRGGNATADYKVVVDIVKNYDATLTGCTAKLSWTDSEGGGGKNSGKFSVPSGRQRYSVTVTIVASTRSEDADMLAVVECDNGVQSATEHFKFPGINT
jgi:hypothetical protein